VIEMNWRKSSYSTSGGGSCVELAQQAATIAVRDSKKPAGPRLAFPVTEFREFLRSR
jgi:hypothetical protein